MEEIAENNSTASVSLKDEPLSSNFVNTGIYNSKFLSKKSAIVLFVIIGIVVLFFFLFFKYKQSKILQAESYINVASLENKVTIYKDTLPPGFPEVIPIASSSKLVQSYSKEYTDKMYQTSIVATSSKTVYENFSYYENFFKNNGWQVLKKQRDENKSVLFGIKENEYLEVTIRRSRISGSNVMINVYKAAQKI